MSLCVRVIIASTAWVQEKTEFQQYHRPFGPFDCDFCTQSRACALCDTFATGGSISDKRHVAKERRLVKVGRVGRVPAPKQLIRERLWRHHGPKEVHTPLCTARLALIHVEQA